LPGVFLLMTHTDQTKQPHPLESGQTWKLEYGYLQILGLGKRLVHYRMLRELNLHVVPTKLIGVVELLTYLKHSEGKLMNEYHHSSTCLT